MMTRITPLCLLALGLFTSIAAEFPPITDFGPTNTYGYGVQRSMRLMESSPADRKRTVKVHFYGQSVIEAYWSYLLADDLKTNFPNARVLSTNLAMGFGVELLSKPAIPDLIPHYPDLLIFHVFGTPEPYEKIIAEVRRRTTADILLQSDHPVNEADMLEPTDPEAITSLSDKSWHNYIFLPSLATTYGAEVANLRSYWKTYLRQYNYRPQDLLGDEVHPNAQGEFVMRQFVRSHLRVDHTLPSDEWRDAVKDIPLAAGLTNSDSTVTLPFIGNRVDLVLSRDGRSPVHTRVDGKKPSEFPEVYAFNRPTYYPGLGWPAILQVNSKTPLLQETWTARVIESMTNGWPVIRFSLHGSKTGFDGEGISTNDFVSNSGRVVITASDWLVLAFATWFFPKGVTPLPVGHEIKWECTGYAIDEFVPKITDPTLENTVTIAQGLANGSHRLTLTSADLGAIEAVRIYNPLARTQPISTTPLKIEDFRIQNDMLTMQISAPGRYVLEASGDPLGPWVPLTSPIRDSNFSTPALRDSPFLRLRHID